MVKEINNLTEWKECLEKNQKVVADFFAEWCGPCRMLAPEFKKVSETFPDLCFVKVNIDNLNDLVQQYKVLSIPTLILFKNGQAIDRNTGFIDSSKIGEWLGKHN